MKMIIPRQELLEAVSKVRTVVSAKSALPILSHILLETFDGQVRLSATDLKVSIECTVDCTVKRKGAFTLSCQRLASVLSELPDDDIVLELGDNNIVILTCGRIETKLYSMSPEEFPPIRTFENVEPVIFEQKLLKSLFFKTSFAICVDQARYNLTGLLCEIHDGVLTVVATDGRRMSLMRQKEGIPDGLEVRVIIPGKMISELERLLGDEGDVKVYFDESQTAFEFDSLRVVSALIEGTFPNYDMVVPKSHDKEFFADTARFQEAVRRTRTMTNEKFNSVRFTLSEGQLKLTVVTPEVGEYHEDMVVEYNGDPLEIAFNPAFILDILRHIDTEKTSIVLKDGMSPGLFRPFSEEKESDYINVVMPIRI